MKSSIAFLGIILCMVMPCFAQDICGTPQNVPNVQPSSIMEILDDCPIYVNIRFHIINYSNGTGGVAPSDIPVFLNGLNLTYNVHNIYFNNGGYDVINNDSWADFNDSKFNSLMTINNQKNAINIYIVPTTNGDYAGRAQNIPSTAFVVDKAFVHVSTFPHELGHCLNLFHTHHGFENGGKMERIDGVECISTGDFICDTPADPILSGKVNSVCVYIGSDTQNGIAYTPDVKNIMSYSVKECRTRFTT